MKFKELSDKYDWEDIYKRFKKLYPKESRNNLLGYKNILDKVLPLLKPKKPEGGLRIVVHTVPKSKWDKWEYVSVSGANEHGKYDGFWAIEFTPWEQWLAMPIDIQSMLEFKEIDILCHCLWEMTWSGFNQKQIQGEIKELNKRVKQVKKNPKKYTQPYDTKEPKKA